MSEQHSVESDAGQWQGHCDRGVCAAEIGHEGTCDEASGWVLTCDDLGCVNGMTVQGRKYDGAGNAEEQWAPCGNRADTCVTPPAEPRA